MSIVLTQADRIAVSRRIIKIDIENGGFNSGITAIDINAAIYLSVDTANAKFSAHWLNVCSRYLKELEYLNGDVRNTIVDADIINAATEAAGNLFFPVITAPPTPGITVNPYLIPQINNNVDGTVTSTNANFEDIRHPTALELIGVMKYGFVPIGAADTDTLTTAYGVGDNHIHINTANFSNGDYLIGESGVNGAVLAVESGPVGGAPPYQYTVREISITGPLLIGATLTNNFAGGFSDLERQNLAGSPYDIVLNSLADDIKGNICSVAGGGYADNLYDLINAGYGEVTLNDDFRTVQMAQNVISRSALADIIAIVNTWEALADTGASGKFIDSKITTLRNGLNHRYAHVGDRLLEIPIALGTVVDDGDGTYSGTDGALYQQYRWLDARANRQYGSYRKYFNQLRTSQLMGNLVTANTDTLADYNTVMEASRFTADSDGSNVIYVEDASLFSPGDPAYVIDEQSTTTELAVTVLGTNLSENSVTISPAAPEGLLKDQLARLYKVIG